MVYCLVMFLAFECIYMDSKNLHVLYNSIWNAEYHLKLFAIQVSTLAFGILAAAWLQCGTKALINRKNAKKADKMHESWCKRNANNLCIVRHLFSSECNKKPNLQLNITNNNKHPLPLLTQIDCCSFFKSRVMHFILKQQMSLCRLHVHSYFWLEIFKLSYFHTI